MVQEKGLVIIPAYNEEKHISEVVFRAVSYLETYVIDDGSKDQTAIQAEKSGAKVFQQIPNQGKGKALIRGFKEALDADAGYVITLDADGQHDVQEIPAFIELYHSKPHDLIIGSRDFSKMPFIRRFSNTVGTISFSWAMGRKISDNQSGYRLISRRLMQKMLTSPESGFEFEVEMIAIAVESNYSIGWVPIKTIYADEKSHIQPLKHVINFFRIVFKTRERMRNSVKKEIL